MAEETEGQTRRLVFVSNRLPISAAREGEGWSVRSSSGGLVTALVPLLKGREALWIGWVGTPDVQAADLAAIERTFRETHGHAIAAVPLDQQEYDRFYEGFCNEIIWPLFHDLQSLCNFVPEYWDSALAVEERFAAVVERHAGSDDLVWIQDYHLMGVAQALRKRGLRNRLAFFLHTPFPPTDIFRKLPWRREILERLLCHDVIGFQARNDHENFLACVQALLPGVEVARHGELTHVTRQGHGSVVGAFPIGLDFDEFSGAAATPAVASRTAELRQTYPDQQIVLGVDRLDYTKGIPYRLRAFARALERHPELHQKVVLVQIVVPSREGVPEYQTLKAEIERLVAQINGSQTQPGWVPVQYIFRSVERDDLLAWYRAADVALVTPFKDGMNLVAKEYCASQVDETGVLVLSEFAGAAEQLADATLVNPYDIDGVANAIAAAIAMPVPERRAAMRKLRAIVKRENIEWWLRQFLAACDRAD